MLRVPGRDKSNLLEASGRIVPVEGRGEGDPPTEPVPDLWVDTSILAAPSPSTSRDQESNGMQTVLLRPIHSSPSFCITWTPTPIRIESLPSLEEKKTIPRGLTVTPPTQEQQPRENRIGSPTGTLEPSWPSTG